MSSTTICKSTYSSPMNNLLDNPREKLKHPAIERVKDSETKYVNDIIRFYTLQSGCIIQPERPKKRRKLVYVRSGSKKHIVRLQNRF